LTWFTDFTESREAPLTLTQQASVPEVCALKNFHFVMMKVAMLNRGPVSEAMLRTPNAEVSSSIRLLLGLSHHQTFKNYHELYI
jgi:hypothetical protein